MGRIGQPPLIQEIGQGARLGLGGKFDAILRRDDFVSGPSASAFLRPAAEQIAPCSPKVSPPSPHSPTP